MAFLIKRGINISHWLSQNNERGEERRSRFRKEDARKIASWGLDHIRIPLDEEQLWDKEGRRYQEAFDLLDQGIQWARDNSLKVIVDLHILRSHYFNEGKEPLLFQSEKEQERFGDLWKDLSEFLKDYPEDFLAYELLNEPVARNSSNWNRVYKIPYNILREREPQRWIVLGSNFFNQWQTFPELEIPDDKKIILTFHYYNPMFITHWKAPWWKQGGFYEGPIQYPGNPVSTNDPELMKMISEKGLFHENRYFDASVLKSDISIPFQVAKERNLPLHCGEFGCRLSIPEEIQKGWYGDLRALFNQWNISWSHWDYRGGFGFMDRDGNETVALKSLLNR